MSIADRLASAGRHLDVFWIIEKLLTLASLTLVAITVGGQLGEMLGLHGRVGTAVAWSIAIAFDTLWIGSLRMSEVAIRQRSTVGMIVMLGLSAVAVGLSSTILLMLGHAKVFAFVPVAAALFMGLRLFAGNVLADAATAAQIAEQSAEDRNARAIAAADARHLRSEATTDVYAETAGHLGEMQRQIARADALTKAQARINRARSKAEGRLTKSDDKHGEKAAAFAKRNLSEALVSHPAVTAGGVTGVTQVKAEIEPVTPEPATVDEPDTVTGSKQVRAEGAPTLAELAAVAGVPVPKPGVTLDDEQIEVVLRWLRYDMDPPRSYRDARKAYRDDHGFIGGEHRVRRIWGEIEARETGTPAR